MIFLALLSAVLHAAWNAILKAQADTRAATVVIIGGAALASGSLGLVLGQGHVPARAWPWILASGAIESVYFVTLAGALLRLPLQTAYGVSRGLGLLLVWPLSVVLLGEPLTPLRACGAGTLVLGLFALVERSGSRRGLLWAVAAACSIALYPLAYKRALDAGVAGSVLFALSLGLALPAACASLGSHRALRLRAAIRPSACLAALICAASFLLFLTALRDLGAAHLTAVRNTSVLFASVFAWWRGEPATRRAVASALAMTVGGVLVTL